MTHKPNIMMLEGKKLSVSYYIINISPIYSDKGKSKTLTKEDLNALSERRLLIDFYDKTGNQLLRLEPHKYNYDENVKVIKNRFDDAVVIFRDSWMLTWKGLLTEEQLTFEAFRDIDSVEVKNKKDVR